jgi:aspartyl-tRNA(Asn)/glutamyl-tRNA(Gln) amidotransferase subunit B
MIYETIIGLEVHVELSTESKMFCRCRNVSLCNEPNRHVCPVCMAAPGALPLINKKAVEYAIRTGLALDCSISLNSKWDRKNYFYPDLPKAYQISQFDIPLSYDGHLSLLNGAGKEIEVGINRVHLEEDAAKLSHGGNETWVDFNRSGLPLIEIVTEPDIRFIKDAESLLREIRRVVRYLGVSHADMEKGQLRCDASISLRPMGEKKLYPRVEIKNLNSFKTVKKALSYEQNRLKALWEKGEAPKEATTVLWDEAAACTKFMRDKEDAADYRFVPEPDIPEVRFEAEWVEAMKSDLPILPMACIRFFIENGLDFERAESISEDPKDSAYLRSLLAFSKEDEALKMLLIKKFLGKDLDLDCSPDLFFTVVEALHLKKISGLEFKEILQAELIEAALEHALVNGVEVDLDAALDTVLSERAGVVNDYHAGKEKVINVLVGKVIQKTQGKVDAKVILEALKERLRL